MSHEHTGHGQNMTLDCEGCEKEYWENKKVHPNSIFFSGDDGTAITTDKVNFRILARTDTCPKCECHCLHDVLHMPDGEIMQCRNGACQWQWQRIEEHT